MPRQAKPYKERGWYISRPFGQYLKLCPVDDGMTEAKRLLKIALGKFEGERERAKGRAPTKLTVSELFFLFLKDTQATKSNDTFVDYQRWCTVFAKEYGNLQARSITKTEASDFKLRLIETTYVRGKTAAKKYAPKTVNHALIAIRRAFNWATDTGRLPAGKNPFHKVELLHSEGRKRVATQQEFSTLIANCSDDAFRDVLVAMRYTSARPQDIYSLTWSMVYWDDHMWVLPNHKGSKTARESRPRTIGMNDEVEKVLRRRQEKFGSNGHVFLNADGKPWKRNAMSLRMRRLRKRAGIKADEYGEEFVLYTNRHTFLTAAGANPSISQAVLAEIAGHTNTKTTDRYVHTRQKDIADAGRLASLGLTSINPA